MPTKNVGVRLSAEELLVLSRVPEDGNPAAIRWLIHRFAEREQQREELERIGDRVIASLSSRIDAITQTGNEDQPGNHATSYDDSDMRKALASMIKHGLIPLTASDRRQPLLQAAKSLLDPELRDR